MQATVVITLVLHVLSGVFWAGYHIRIGANGWSSSRVICSGRNWARRRSPIVTGALLVVPPASRRRGASERILATGAVFALIAAGVQAVSGVAAGQWSLASAICKARAGKIER